MRSSSLHQATAVLPVVLCLLVEANALCADSTLPPARDATVAAPSGDPFPASESLRDRVEFWRSAFAVWGRGQVALHDLDHPSLVYEVLDLPGEIRDTYTEAQERFVRSRKQALEARLRALTSKIVGRAPLTDDEKTLALDITTHAGIAAILGADRRVRPQRGLRERFRRGLEISGRYDVAFREIFRAAGVPEDLAYLPHVESSFQTEARSSAGAVGIWQFTRPAARVFLKLNSVVDERRDPIASARGAARYLREAYDLLGDWALALTSYNHGLAGMSRAKARFGNDFDRIINEYDGRSFGFASKSFYCEFLAVREIAQNTGAFFPEGLALEPPLALDRMILDKPATAHRIAEVYGVPVAKLVSLNASWLHRAVKGGIALPTGTEVWLPDGTLARVAATENRRTVGPDAATGQKLVVRDGEPTASPSWSDAIVHVVQRGESLFTIAASYGLRAADLFGPNKLTARSIIHPGQRIQIPLGR